MFARGYVCHRCRVQSLQRANTAIEAQRLVKASYISLAQQPSPTIRPSHELVDDVTNIHTSPSSGRNRHPSRKQPAAPNRIQPVVSQRSGRYSGSAVPLPFEAPSRGEQRSVQDGQTPNQSPQKKAVGTATQLAELLKEPETLREAWSYFLRNYPSKDSPNLLSPAYQDLQHLQYGEVFKKMLQMLSSAWAVNTDPVLPRPNLVMQQLRNLGIWRHNFWELAGWPLAKRLLIIEHQQQSEQQAVAENVLSELQDWWIDLISRHAKYARRLQTGEGSQSINWSYLQHNAAHNPNAVRRSAYFDARFPDFFQGLPTTPTRSIPALALVTCDLLSRDTGSSNLSAPKQEERVALLKTLLLLINGKHIARTVATLRGALSDLDGALPSVAVDDYVQRIHQLPDRALAMIESINASSIKATGENEGPRDEDILSSEERIEKVFVTRIQRTQSRQDTSQMQRIWQQLKVSYQMEEGGQQKCNIPATLYDQLISAFFALRRGDAALEVWKFMVENGTQPTTKTWNAMIDGARAAKDFKAAEGIWHRMLASGVEPDEVSWIVRITTLVQAYRHQEALMTLEELGQRWLKSGEVTIKPGQNSGVQSRNNDPEATGPATDDRISSSAKESKAVKPAVKIVNAVLAALAKTNNERMFSKVLEWAKQFGIQPNAYTYNALISAAIAKGRPSDAYDLLQKMSSQGIEPDTATHTIVLDHTLVNVLTGQSLSKDQVRIKALEVLDDLEAHGLKVTDYVYSLLIDRLLKHHNNLPAAQAIVARMHEKGLEPTQHAYTSLITYYFTLDPPDLKSVSDLVQRVETHFQRVDNYLYDRLLQGYARHDQTQRLVGILHMMKREGRNPSWQALKETALALERAEDWRTLNELVMDVERREGIVPFEQETFSRTQKGVFFGIIWRLRGENKIAPSSVKRNRARRFDRGFESDRASQVESTRVPSGSYL